MEKFKFKLDGLLKLREFKENRLKQELGAILQEIQRIDNEIIDIQNSIVEAYESQQELLKEASMGSMIQFYPYFIKGRKEDELAKKQLLKSLNHKYQLKLLELKTARGEVKLIENMKEDKLKIYKKNKQKKHQDDIDDILNMKRVNE